MVNSLEVLALIPARGGSKSIPRKNIRLFAGFPLIAWTIAAAKQATSVSRVIVSTDDEEIAAVARRFGADVPFIRPKQYARDTTPDLSVFTHALAWLTKHEHYQPHVVVQLRPTSPIRPGGLIDTAVDVLVAHPKATSARGVVPAGQNPYKMWRVAAERRSMEQLLTVPGLTESYNAPRQILPPVYWQTGHIDVIRPQTIFAGSMSGKRIYPVMIDPVFACDLDTELDWRRAEWMVGDLGRSIVRPHQPR